MKNVIEILDRYYQSFINQKRDWDFFLGLAYYVKYATEIPEVDKILKSTVQKRANAEKRLKEYEEDAIKEAKEVIRNKVFQKIKEKKISYEELNKLMQEWDNYANRRILSSQSDAEALSGCLMDIIRSLHDTNYKEITKDFIIEEETDPKIIKEYTCFRKLELYKKEKLAYQEKEEIEPWGAWGNLALVYIVIFKREEELERLRKDKRNWWTASNLQGLIGEMQKIKGQSVFSDSKPVWFIKDAYIGYATRIHNYLIQELSKKENEKTTERQIKKTTLFLKQDGELYKKPKEKYCYPMGEKGDRHKTVRFLAENRGYQQTIEISSVLGDKNIKSVQTEIYKINNIAIGKLEIKNKLIEGKKGSGYRINPKYKVIFKNE